MLRLLVFLNQQFDDPRGPDDWSPTPSHWVSVAVLFCLIVTAAIYALIDLWLWKVL
jgi:hypothetical protein